LLRPADEDLAIERPLLDLAGKVPVLFGHLVVLIKLGIEQSLPRPREVGESYHLRDDRSVRVHRPRVTLVQQRTSCGSMKTEPAAIGPEVAPEGASV